ncbi:hypothetical protein HDG32_002842 [Paraburkholderia sp. CI2]|uniref:hypothetical protein n=1 Tax=Paraburkholderia sp. CI2 TaxID=2723093 RepID=UPI00161650FA|nr:hypothetical protein [Paraburkholderia sp. CI2]MBB5466724.1 hypothetical protein [Paraburkholderia sp. CI2]
MTTRRAGDPFGIDYRDARDKVLGSTSETFDNQTVILGAAALASKAVNLPCSKDFPTVFHREATLGAKKSQFGYYVCHIRKLYETIRVPTSNDLA